VQSWSKLTSRGVRFALELSPDVRALHILTQDSTICELTAVWEELVAGPARAAGMPAAAPRSAQVHVPAVLRAARRLHRAAPRSAPRSRHCRHRARPGRAALVPRLPAQQPLHAPPRPATAARRSAGRRRQYALYLHD
jgi:hypothetical protein